MGSWFNSDAKMIYPLLGTEKTFENSETKQILGIEFTDIKSSVCEMSDSLIETGYVKGPKMPKSSRKKKSSGTTEETVHKDCCSNCKEGGKVCCDDEQTQPETPKS